MKEIAPKKQKKVHIKEDNNLEIEVKVSDPNVSDTALPLEPPSSYSEQPTVTTTETIKIKSGRKRSVCAMQKVVLKKSRGKKFKVTSNELGFPSGSSRAKLQSYIGMLARNRIPIDISSWPKVDANLKEKIWIDVQDTFRISPNCQDVVLKSAGSKWRQFKTTLTNKFVLPFLGQKKKLSRPPKQYDFVGKSAWKNFVKQRADPNWVSIHEVQSDRVHKRKYHHRLSRKGYAGLKEEEIKSGELEPGEEPDRAIFWKKARLPKDNKVDEEQAKINEKIDMLLEANKKGELHCARHEDVLILALETPENSGRVRAVGGYITPKSFFKLPSEKKIRITKSELMARDRQRSEEMEGTKQELLSEMAQLKAMITAGVNIHSPNLSDKASFHPAENDQPAAEEIKITPQSRKGLVLLDGDDDVDVPTQPEKLAPRQCELAVGSIDTKVAFGLVFPHDKDLPNLIHGRAMPHGCLRVSVDGSIKSDALLPVPVPGEMETVQQALGSHVAWPEELISYPTNVIKKKELPRAKKLGELQKLQALFSEAKPSAKVPKGFNLLYKHATSWMKTSGTSIQLPCDLEVFGREKTIFLLHENILALLEFEMIGQAVISTYMLYLHTELRDRGELDTVAFIDPGSTYHLNDAFETDVVSLLKKGKGDHIFFLPYNHNMHWILSIIWDGDIYILNPLSHASQFLPLERALTRAVKGFNSEKVPKVKYLSGSPKQPGGIECGYVVMRYMKEIIEDKELIISGKWMAKSRKTYSLDQLEEVRIEALQFIQEHI